MDVANEPAGARVAEAAAVGEHSPAAAADACVFLEAIAGEGVPPRYLVRVIRAGTSLNGVHYPREVLREAAPLFDGVRVFAKSDGAHIKGDADAKDFRALIGRLAQPRFVEAGPGEVQAVLDVLESSDVAPKLREAVSRGMTDLFGLSIDATGASRKSGRLREATRLTRIDSVDLIIEPGAGGGVIRFAEAAPTPKEHDTMLREQMLKFIEARDANRATALADASDEAVLSAYGMWSRLPSLLHRFCAASVRHAVATTVALTALLSGVCTACGRDCRRSYTAPTPLLHRSYAAAAAPKRQSRRRLKSQGFPGRRWSRIHGSSAGSS